MTETIEQKVDSVVVGVAQRPGTEPPCADGHDVQRRGSKVCAAVVDGAGHHEDVVRYSSVAPAAMTHIGMALGGLAGLITAGQMAHAYGTPPHASAVYACMEPGWPTAIHWIGDCRAYGWDGTALGQWSTDATMGQWLRRNGGVPVEVAERHDNWSRLGLAQASAATCRQVEIPEDVRLVLLVSDGVSDQVDPPTMETLCRRHATDPQALADALVAAAKEDDAGYRDDATVIAMLRRTD
ncbi:SpoIIE family protein phosphatase [Streptomyces sp. NBC_00424]|uniref:SpoIIE family protein phosphatase n=1 Tax=Streptomyces sp. NBC_00424 TaxID=2903648 RepID=UPI00224CBD90|nr:SpoIIE family protein phosphatase [Streptomyces sp. NBC_00424]MCX5077759.1 SpoIIE family protein phosphatase [Streptomyces sp. NBC_00424]